jgi:hypothetical protein
LSDEQIFCLPRFLVVNIFSLQLKVPYVKNITVFALKYQAIPCKKCYAQEIKSGHADDVQARGIHEKQAGVPVGLFG